MKEKTLYLICNAHLDPVWLWNMEEGISAALSTFHTAADFCENYDGFVFNHNEALLYQWIEEYDLPLFERIQSLVKDGKWHIMGGWYLQPDCNMPSGESFLRQIRSGQEYFREKFGVTLENRHERYNETLAYIREQERSGNLLVIRPEAPLNIGAVERHPEELERVYQIGRKEGEKRLREVKKFLKRNTPL